MEDMTMSRPGIESLQPHDHKAPASGNDPLQPHDRNTPASGNEPLQPHVSHSETLQPHDSRNESAGNTSGGKTLGMAFFLSAPGPIFLWIAYALGGSATQLADALRRSADLFVTAGSWRAFRRFGQADGPDAAKRERTERRVDALTTAAIGFAGVVLAVIAMVRLAVPRPVGNVWMGLVIAFLGLATNGFFWLRYRAMVRQGAGSVIRSQQQLYRAKTMVDACVVAVLLLLALAPGSQAGRLADLAGTLGIAVWLLVTAVRQITAPQPQPLADPPPARTSSG